MFGATVGILRLSQCYMPIGRRQAVEKSAKICRLWHTGQSPLAYRAVTADMPTVAPTFARIATVGELDAEL
jgi:hypothetical protein